MDISTIKEKVYKKRAELTVLDDKHGSLMHLYEQAMAMKTHIEKAQKLVQHTAKATQERVKYELEQIVNHAMSAVFGDMYSFEIIFEIKRGKTEARIVLLENGNEIDPLDGTGGGACDVLSFALRIALLIVSKGTRILILDEVGKFISENLKPIFYQVLTELSSKLKIQIIAVTHDPLMQGDKVIRVLKNKGVSYVQSN